jgi:PPK2 family polyphosphate:nucleotide phosphotransferase
MNPDQYRVSPGATFSLSDWDPNDTAGIEDKEVASALLKIERKRIRDLQERLYAGSRQSLLVILQATDTGGKDGTIKHVFRGVNQQGCQVRAFKVPNDVELAHDFLWRYHQHTPRDGYITIFNRSHYEDVLVVRVKGLVEKDVWKKRYDHINDFERLLSDNGTRVLKFYLHISKDEQKKRLQARLDDPAKHWKFSKGDLVDREMWDDYQAAFHDAIAKCSTDAAPWHVIPANHKWFRNLLIARIVADTLEEMNPRFPAPEEGLEDIVIPD